MSFERKKRLMAEAEEMARRAPPPDLEAVPRAVAKGMDAFRSGRLLNIENVFLRWKDETWFEYLPHPDPAKRFGFRRASGEVVTPGRMFTNGGSIPRQLWWKQGLAPWDYGPAYLLHDWEFDLHYCGRQTKSFEEVRDTLMEAVRTMMELGVGVDRPGVFRAILAGVDSLIARRLWEETPGCTLPEE